MITMNDIIGETESLKRRSPDEMEARVGLLSGDRNNGRREKAWQRVPCVYIFLVLSMYLVLGHLTQMIEDSMPVPKFDEDLPIDDSELDVFSEESGWYFLLRIIGEKPKVAGTQYHLKKTEDLKNILENIARDVILPVKVDWQMTSGDFSLNTSLISVNSYQRVSNLAALLEGQSGFNKNGSIGSTILVNCHYDSVPGSPGASDNGIFCAVMAVLLQKLSRASVKLKHNIVFLFNGAEENPLQGSHAFLQHPWSKNIIAVVNLDAAGMNGKPNLFQVTDPRVLESYQRTCNRPSAQSVGEMIFTSGLIPSDTDFRIWRDYGKFYGIDLAFIKWGHVYHTFNDHPRWIQKGVIQESGDMLLALVKDMANDVHLNTKISPSSMVYYDYLNLFLVVYPSWTAHLVDGLAAVIGLLSVYCYLAFVGLRWSTVHELCYAVGGRVAAAGAGIVTVVVFLPFTTSGELQLRYLSHAWLVIAMYWIPYLLGATSASHCYDAWRTRKSGLNRLSRTLQAMAATRLLVAVFLLVLLCVPSLAQLRYVFSLPLLVASLTSFLMLGLNKYVRLAAWQHLSLELLFSVPTVMFLFSLSLRVNALMLPIMGRNPIDKPDYIVAILNLVLVILVATTMSGIELLFSRQHLWLVVTPLAALCLIAMFKSMHPYVSPTTQRHTWFHSRIKSVGFNNEIESNRSGVLILRWDAYNVANAKVAFEKHQYWFSVDANMSKACEEYVYCNLPLYRTSLGKYLSDAMFITTGPPNFSSRVPELKLVKKSCSGDVCSQHYTMIGLPHNLLTVSPRKGVDLKGWSWNSPPRPAFLHRHRPVYVIAHSVATHTNHTEPFNFTLTLHVPTKLQEGPVVDISHHAHQVLHTDDVTTEFMWLLHTAPEYFSLVPFASDRTNYVF